MKSNKEYIEQIEKYLDGEMEGSELDAFKIEIESNPELRAELKVYELASSAIIQHKISSVKTTIDFAKKEYVQKRKSKKLRTIVFAATGFILAFGILYLWQSDNSAEKIENKIRKPEILRDTISINSEKLQKNDTDKEINTDPVIRKNISVTKSNETKVEDKVSKNSPIPIEDTSAAADKNIFIVIQDTAKISPEKNTNNQQTDKDPISISPCEKTQITAKTTIVATCIAENNGEIHISQVNGGTTPYSFQLQNQDDNISGIFTNLKKGEYSITITDKNLCTEIINSIKVTEKTCQLDLYMEIGRQDLLNFPVYEKAGTLSIFDKMGTLLYTTNISKKIKFEWSGQTNNGMLAPGYYPFIIKFEDGTIQNGSITATP